MTEEKKEGPGSADTDAFVRALQAWSKEYLRERGWEATDATKPNIQMLVAAIGSASGGVNCYGSYTAERSVQLGYASLMSTIRANKDLRVALACGEAASDLVNEAKKKVLVLLGVDGAPGDISLEALVAAFMLRKGGLAEPHNAKVE